MLCGFITPANPSAAAIPEILEEDDAVRIAQASQSVAALHAAQLDLARSDVQRERIWPNPLLDYTREEAGDAEQLLTLTQSIDVSGRRGLRSRAASLRVDATQSDIASAQLDLASVVRSEFTRAVHQQERVRALTAWSQKIAAAAETAARLQAGGEVSGYDRRRLERELEGTEAALAAARGALVAAKRRLAALLGSQSLTDVTLQPSTAPAIPADDELSARIEQRPDAIAMSRRIDAATLELKAARRWFVPNVDLTAGTKETEAENGSVVGAGIALPIFDRHQSDELRARAELALLTAQRTLLLARAGGEVHGLAAEARELRRAAGAFRERALPTSQRLTATAEAAYRAGEVGILELLDAYRTALDADIQAAELEQRAREVEIELTRALGGSK